jgi:hypothetical protein
MSHVFISYKREDEVRVADLVRALQANGLEIWWDKNLPGGESWRENIEHALDQAGCVVVVWTENSVGPAGEFVRDEAGRAKARGLLAPVKLDNVMPPLGFGEVQAIDLSRWRGGAKDLALLDLVAACRAKLDGKPAPAPKAAARALFRQAAIGSSISALLLGGLTFGANLFASQDNFCSLPLGQPGLADFCGSLRIGGKPSRAERLAWADRPKGSCEALRQFIDRYPDGAYRSEAAALLQAAKSAPAATFSPTPRTSHGYVRQSETPFRDDEAAQADARARAAADAAGATCAPVDDSERLAGADLTSVTFDCRASPLGGRVCAANYVARCRIETRLTTETCG